MTNAPQSGLTGLGKVITALIIVGLIGLGAWVVMKRGNTPQPGGQEGPAGPAVNNVAPGTPAKTTLDTSDLDETKNSPQTLVPAVAYAPKNNTVDIELSQYAGYAGLIAANGGLAPNPDSVFAKKYGFKLNITLSEEESWNSLNSGKIAASATTADVLAVYGRQLQAVVPAQIGFSRGADGLVVRSDIKRINQLKGKTVVATQFTESDFFVRYLANEAGIGVNAMADLNGTPDADKINIVYAKGPEQVMTLLAKDIDANTNQLAGGMSWAPFTTDAVANSKGKLRLLTTNRNLLIIADVLIVNRPFAEKHPEMVAGLVDGLLSGNRAVRDNPEQYADLIAKALTEKDDKWDRGKALAELQKVHLANLPENTAFFSGGITAGGSFAGIYQSAVLAYGNQYIPNPVDSDHFVSLDGLKKAEAGGAYKDQVAAIAPIQTGASGPIETDPLLSRDIRFYFEPNSDRLDVSNKDNMANLNAIKKMLDVSPGSRVLLRGHVDNSNVAKFRKDGGEQLVQKMAMEAMDLSKRRAAEIKKLLISKEQVEGPRLEVVGRGWEEPASTNPDENRRVEVQWFTLE